jgi:hypothetical protein
MVDGLREEPGAFVEDLLCEVIKTFEPLARREWLEWGANILFLKLREVVEAEVHVEAEEKQSDDGWPMQRPNACRNDGRHYE